MSILNKYISNLKANHKINKGLIDDQSGVITTTTAVGGTAGYWVKGEHGVAFRSPTNTSYLDLGTDTRTALKSCHSTGIFTVGIRCRFLGTATTRILGSTTNAINRGFSLYRDSADNSLCLQRSATGNTQQHSTSILKIGDDAWHTIIIKGDGTNVRFCLDGVYETSATAITLLEDVNMTANLQIGRSGSITNWGGNEFDRLIYLDANMSDDDMTALYAELQAERPIGIQPKTGYVNPSQVTTGTGIVGGWNFKINGDTVTDVKGTASLTKVGGCINEEFLFRNSGVRLDGSTGYLRKAVSDYRSADSQGGISFMYIPYSFSANMDLFCSSDEASTVRYLIIRQNSSNRINILQANNDTSDSVFGSTSITKSTPTHIVVNSTGSAYEIYVNGVLESLNIISGSNSGDWFADTPLRDNLVWGALVRLTPANYANATFLRARIRSTPFTQAEVTEMYNEMANIPIYYMNLLGDPVSLYTLSAGSNVADWAIQTGTWRVDEDSTGKHLLCVTNGQIKTPLIRASAYTTKTFTTSGTATLTKNANDLQIDATAGAKIYNLIITP